LVFFRELPSIQRSRISWTELLIVYLKEAKRV
jgi:hypothetical protein